MTKLTKAITVASAFIITSGGYNLYACSSCGCSPVKKAEPKPAESCASGVCSPGAAQKTAEKIHGHEISTLQLKGHVDSGTAILLDARSGKYDDGYRITGAKSLSSTSTAEEVAKIIPSKDSQVITYCTNLKCPASGRLADHLKKLGYTHIHEYPEGIEGWRAAGGQVEKAK